MTASESAPGPTGCDGAEEGRFGDRHLRGDPDRKLDPDPTWSSARVGVFLDAQLGCTVVGQLGAWLCVNLLSRLDGLVEEIELVCPRTAPQAAVTRLLPATTRHASLVDWLSETCATVSADRVRLIERSVEPTAGEPPMTVQIAIGRGTPPRPATTGTIWCFGEGWLAYTGMRPTAILTAPAGAAAERRTSANPLGLYMAVCFAVAEVFKTLRGVRSGVVAKIEDLCFSLWTGETGERWDELADGPEIDSLTLQPGYLVGGGAVGQAVALAIATATAGAGFVTVIDEETIDRENRNRYVLTGAGDEGKSKAELVADFLRATGTLAHSEALHWLPYTTRMNSHPERGLAALEQRLRYALIVSCVDTNLARHEIQRFWPADIIGGSTDGLRALAVHYDLRTSTACLACHNPLQDFEREATRLRREVAGRPRDAQRVRLLDLGVAPEVVDAVLNYLERPKCGELGEAALRKFAEKGPPAFSVGFVSVAAGLLVARHWIRYAILGAEGICPSGRHYLAVNFCNGRALWTEQGIRDGCICQSHGRRQWQNMWT